MAHADGSRRQDAILIAGPTASGKSALALRIAERIGGRIINADSMQVYRDLRVITARPTAAETARVPHRLYGTVDAAVNHSVSLWLAEASRELALARADDVTPILVGGSGLYFKALTQGLSDIPPVPDDVRAEVRSWAASRSVEALHEELVRRDPATASRLRATDPQRILRALEVHLATGKSLAVYQACREPPILDAASCMAVALEVVRDALRTRIDERFDRMIAAGALEEVERLVARKLDPVLPAMRAIGVPSLSRYLAGGTKLAAAIEDAKTATRQYIKRQDTFVRHQLPSFRRLSMEAAEAVLLSAPQS